MGSARIQYELERTLSSLQLAVEHEVFDKETEIRSITQKRRQFESALVRRHALSQDFHHYLDYEEDLHKLLLMRLRRVQETSEIPRSDVHKMQHDSTRHMISIFERAIKRIRHDFSLWQRYILWAKQRKMRGAISRISARALSLFPNNVNLWLSVADHELNANLNPSTARALLQRGLRLNGIVHHHSVQASSSQHSSKRSKMNNGQHHSAPLTIRPAGLLAEDTPSLQVGPKELAAIRLWIEYIRMELIFLERIRRRKIALNITDSSKATEEVETDAAHDKQGEEESEEENVSVHAENGSKNATIAQIAEDESIQHGKDQSLPQADSIILGAIPITAIKSALSLDSTVSLPPQAHFCFLLALTRMVDEFPFYGDASELRRRLTEFVDSAINHRFDHHPTAILFESALPLYRSTTKSGLEDLTEIEMQEELETSNLLKKASHLNRREISDLERQSDDGQSFVGVDFEGETKGNQKLAPDAASNAALFSVLDKVTRSLQTVTQDAEIATLSRVTLDSLRRRVMTMDKPTDAHMSVQIRLIQQLRSLGISRNLGDDFDAFLLAYTKRVLQDAKRLGNAGKEVELARLQGMLVGESLKSAEQVSNCAKSAIEASRRYEGDRRYAVIAGKAVLQGLQKNLIDKVESQKLWRVILKSIKGTDHVDVWQIWSDSLVESFKDNMDKDNVRVQRELQHAIVHDVIGEKAAQSALLERLYGTQNHSSNKVALELLSWAKNKGVAGPEFWRYVVLKEENHLQRLNDSKDFARSPEIENTVQLIRFAFVSLIASSESADDIARYLRFLCLQCDAQQEAIALFSNHTQRMSPVDIDGMVKLEREWKMILNEIRHSEQDVMAESDDAEGLD